MRGFDPGELARRQIDLDRQQTRRFPATFDRKVARMRASPLAFLRGAAPLFYDVLRAEPELAEGPAGEGWIVGDAHLENFGAFVPAGGKGVEGGSQVFDLNDFDDTMVAPLRFDLLRLGTSFLLGARELGATGGQALEMVNELLTAWALHVTRARALPPVPRPVQALLRQMKLRSRADLLNARTQVVNGKRRFVRGPRYGPLPADVRRGLPAAFARYADSITDGVEHTPEQLEIIDAAHRIAGTGSLGVLRIAVLVAGKGGVNGGSIFDLKEQREHPSGAVLGQLPPVPPAQRVVDGMRKCLVQAPRRLGTTELVGLSLFGRRLAPQEDRLDLTRIPGSDLPSLAHYLGALLGRAHRRGATSAPRDLGVAARAATIERTIRLAGLHEAVYLAYCHLTS